MAIRKDLDDMLNNLAKSSTNNAPKSEKSTAAKPVPKKSIYDDMSVDDLLNALTDQKKKPSAEIAGELSPKPAKSVPKAKAPTVPEKKQETVKTPTVLEVKQETVKVPTVPGVKQETVKTSTISETEPKTDAPAKKEQFAPLKLKKKIIISKELPDYEAIRQKELEKDRAEQQQAETAIDVPEEPVPAEPPVSEQLTAPVKETPSPTEEESADKEKITETEKAPKEKKGFFSRLKNKQRPNDEPAKDNEEILSEKAEVTEEQSEAAPPKEEFPEADDDFLPVEDDLPSADELINAALAAFENEMPLPEADLSDDTAVSGLPSDSPESSLTIAEEVTPENDEAPRPAEENAPEKADETDVSPASDADNEENTAEDIGSDDSTPDENTDPADTLINNIREETAAAVAEIENPNKAVSQEETDEIAEETSENDTEEAQEEEKPKKQSVLKKIMDEDPDELINERSEKTEQDKDISPKKALFKKRLYAALGVIFAIFALIGVITVAGKGVQMIKNFTTGEIRRDGFTEVVYPAVIMDIESFNSPTELTSEQIVTASIWAIIMSEDKISKYAVNPGTDTVSIPYMDVEAQAVEMFGTDHPEFEHCTVGPPDSRFFYSDGVYNVRVKPITFTYSPEIRSIVKSGSDYTLTVDYVDELPSWMEKSVSKSVEFRLTEKEDGTYYIRSMKILYVKSSQV